MSNLDVALLKSRELRQKLYELNRQQRRELLNFLSSVDVIITTNEINYKHGTGIFLLKIFKESSEIFSLRSSNGYGAEHYLGDVAACLPCEGLSQPQIFSKILEEFGSASARRIVCVPYKAEEINLTLAIKELFNVPLCTYIMDDQNIYIDKIANELVKKLLEKSDLRLAISPELQAAYEAKYNLKFWLVPPLVERKLIQLYPQVPSGEYANLKIGALVGNIWSNKWLESLHKVIANSEIKIYWYGNSKRQLILSKDQLKQGGIYDYGFLKQESDLVQILRQHLYAILPTGTTNERSDRPEIARLSLPSRLVFITATSHTPIIVLGSKETAAARFVERFKIGIVCDYNPFSFREAVDFICSADIQVLMRQNAANIADFFAVDNIAEWLWQSLEQGQPLDWRFEKFRDMELTHV